MSALDEIRGVVFRAKQMVKHPGERHYADVWLGDALHRLDRLIAAEPVPGEGLEHAAADLARRITEAVNAGARPVDDMGLASILHHYAHQVSDARETAAV